MMTGTDDTSRVSQTDAADVYFGIPGLDEVFDGEKAIPANSLFLVEGPPGSGKTTLALQFLRQAVREGKACLLVSNAETPTQLDRIAASHGWDLEGIHVTAWMEPTGGADGALDAEYTLFPEAEVEVTDILGHLFAEVERVRPSRLVIDTASALRVLAPSPAFYRRQLKRIRDFLFGYDCTTLVLDDALTSEKDIRSQTLVDGILELRQIDQSYGGDRRRLRVRKLRGATYISGFHDFIIKSGGIEVFPRLVATRHEQLALIEPATSGNAALDALVGGGLPRGSSTLVMGPAGTGKSSLVTLYVHAAAQRGERSAVCLFDESTESYIARSRGLGVDIAGAVEAGHIQINHLDPAESTPGEIAHRLVREVEEGGARVVVIDAINGYLQSAINEPQVVLHLRELLSYLARRQVVTLLVLTQHGFLGGAMSTPVDVSFIADNVILLRYFEAEGRVHQAVSVMKKRIGNHERTIRELTLTAGGIRLSEPLEGFSGVLTGVPVPPPPGFLSARGFVSPGRKRTAWRTGRTSAGRSGS